MSSKPPALLSFSSVFMLFFWACLALNQAEAAEKIKPFVLGSSMSGDPKQALAQTKSLLAAQGFEILGDYAPYEGAHVMVVTNDFLKKLATEEKGGAYFAVQRVSVTQSGGMVQVAYANPEYLKYAYRINKDVSPVANKLRAALGAETEFGAEGLTQAKLRKYQYTFGMEYFDDPMKLASYPTHKEAVDAIEKNLLEQAASLAKVYRLDLPAGNLTVIGVALKEGAGSDKGIMEIIDAGQLKHTAALPYELVVFDNKVEALHPRFRIAINFPDLKMVGKNSFGQITRAPDAIKKTLTLVAGGTWEDSQTSGGFEVR